MWDVAGSAETGGTPGSGSTTMGVDSPTMGGNSEGTVDTLPCLPAGGGGSLRGNRGRVRLTLGASSSTWGSAVTVVEVSSTVSSTVVSMGG